MLKPYLALRILTLSAIKIALLDGSLTPCNDNLQRKGSKIQCTVQALYIEVFSPLFNGDLSLSCAIQFSVWLPSESICQA